MADEFNISDQPPDGPADLKGIFAAGQWGYVAAKNDDKVKGIGVLEQVQESNNTSLNIVDENGTRIQGSSDGTLNDEVYNRTRAAVHQLDQNILWIWKFLLDSNANVRWFIGLHEGQALSPVAADDIGDPAVGVLFSTSRPDTNFQFAAHDGAVQTLVDSGVPVDTAPHFLKIDANAAGDSTIVSLLDASFTLEASTTFTTEGPGPTVELNSQEWLRALAASVESQSLYYGTVVARGA
jgi:hypothetical protein